VHLYLYLYRTGQAEQDRQNRTGKTGHSK
jgi:hypothetical protein